MKLIPQIVTLAFLSFVCSEASGAQLAVIVRGVYYANGEGPTLMVTSGVENIAQQAVEPQVDYNTYYDPHDEWDESTQSYIWVEYRTEPDWNTQRTVYSVTVPDTWIGHSVSFFWAGNSSYTSGTPLLGAYQEFDLNNWDGSVVPSGYSSAWPTASTLGGRLLVGHWWNNDNIALFNVNSWDNWDTNWPSAGLEFVSSRSNAFWRWMHRSGTGTPEFAMDLDYLHRLTLPKRGSQSQKIVLDPEAGQIMINGNNVLTRSSFNSSLAFGTYAYAPYGGVALGYNAYSSGYPSAMEPVPEIPTSDGAKSIAIGDFTQSYGHGASAVGSRAYASGSFSLALGGYAKASGLESFAGGLKSEAAGTASVALGAFAQASGPKSVALGYRTKTQGYGQTVVGVNNVPVGNPNDPSALDSEVFVVGGGSYEWLGINPVSVPRNAFTVKRGGNTNVAGTLTVSGTGESVINGTVRINRIVRQGDILMGEFGNPGD